MTHCNCKKDETCTACARGQRQSGLHVSWGSKPVAGLGPKCPCRDPHPGTRLGLLPGSPAGCLSWKAGTRSRVERPWSSPWLLFRPDPHPAGAREPAERSCGSLSRRNARGIPGQAAKLRRRSPPPPPAPGRAPSWGRPLGGHKARLGPSRPVRSQWSSVLSARCTAPPSRGRYPPPPQLALSVPPSVSAGAGPGHGGGRCRRAAARRCCCGGGRCSRVWAAARGRRPSAPAAGVARGQALHLVSPRPRPPLPAPASTWSRAAPACLPPRPGRRGGGPCRGPGSPSSPSPPPPRSAGGREGRGRRSLCPRPIRRWGCGGLSVPPGEAGWCPARSQRRRGAPAAGDARVQARGRCWERGAGLSTALDLRASLYRPSLWQRWGRRGAGGRRRSFGFRWWRAAGRGCSDSRAAVGARPGCSPYLLLCESVKSHSS